ncbi:DNA polymerase III subunit alpha [Paenibacillus beijingensis]|uniref:DNA polymerase III subunit alpha n=1 Tax=Paenibacillus beijingensis TaxID=1126833 RepID=UPI000695E710|nr:DNA polymerase III subunit alpha [Paenibacillus beijingensis]
MKRSGAKFVHLHVHTEYSLSKALCKLDDLIRTANSWNMEALAVTDMGTVNGAFRFHELAKRHGIHPVIGCEMTVGGRGETLLLLAASNRGYEQIIERLNSGAFDPPASNGDIIALSGGRTGIIHQLIADGQMAEAEEQALQYLRTFGKDNFFLEVQDHGLARDKEWIERTVRLSRRTGIPLVATHDVHYVVPEDAALLELLQDARTSANRAEQPKSGPFHLPSPHEMVSKFSHLPDALANTVRIARRCRFRPEPGHYRLPAFSVAQQKKSASDRQPRQPAEPLTAVMANPALGSEEALRNLCREGLVQRFGSDYLKNTDNQAVLERLNEELEVIINRGLADYFLIVANIVRMARNRRIPVGPGRGSAAGSLAAYSLGITEVNPLLHGLSFERFLSPDRPGLPDIDLDVCQRRRHEILQDIKEKYGPDRVVHVGVLNRYGTRGAVRKAGACLGMPQKQIDVLAGLMPAFSGKGGLRHCLQTLPELQKLPVRQEPFRSWFGLAERIEGLAHNYSTHPSGILIGDERMTRTIPYLRRPNGERATPFTKEDTEMLGLLKIDLLGLRNLTIIDDTLAAVRERTGSSIEVNRLPLDDPDTFRTIACGNTVGCFQLESMGIRHLMRRLKPQSIGELADLLALYRPGAWSEGIVDTYLRRRQGDQTYRVALPEMEPVLSSTYGLILYQEQIMAIAHAVAGYSMGEADSLRRALSAKSAHALADHRERFVLGAAARGIADQEADAVFDFLARFAGYSFNKAHSVSYAYLSYWTVYLKTHYPSEYMASVLSGEGGYYDKKVYLMELGKLGIPLFGPDINRSRIGFHADDEGVRAGIDAVRGCGPKSVAALLRSRDRDGEFRSFAEFIGRMNSLQVKRPVLEAWIGAGACDSFSGNRRQMLAALSDEGCDVRRPPSIPDFTGLEKRSIERKLLGFALNPSPSGKWKAFADRFNVVPIEALSESRDYARVRICGTIIHSRRQAAGGKYVLVLVVQDHTGMIETVLSPGTYNSFLYELNPRGILIEGLLRMKETNVHMVAEKIKALGG